MEVTSHMSCQMKLGCPAVIAQPCVALGLVVGLEKHEEAALSNKNESPFEQMTFSDQFAFN